MASVATGAEVGYGVAVGPSLAEGQAPAQWRDLAIRAGSKLDGLAPLVADGSKAGQQRLVLGPFMQQSQARDMCRYLEQIEIPCTPASYSGALISR